MELLRYEVIYHFVEGSFVNYARQFFRDFIIKYTAIPDSLLINFTVSIDVIYGSFPHPSYHDHSKSQPISSIPGNMIP